MKKSTLFPFKALLLGAFLFVCSSQSWANHIYGMQIGYQYQSPGATNNTFVYRVSVSLSTTVTSGYTPPANESGFELNFPTNQRNAFWGTLQIVPTNISGGTFHQSLIITNIARESFCRFDVLTYTATCDITLIGGNRYLLHNYAGAYAFDYANCLGPFSIHNIQLQAAINDPASMVNMTYTNAPFRNIGNVGNTNLAAQTNSPGNTSTSHFSPSFIDAWSTVPSSHNSSNSNSNPLEWSVNSLTTPNTYISTASGGNYLGASPSSPVLSNGVLQVPSSLPNINNFTSMDNRWYFTSTRTSDDLGNSVQSLIGLFNYRPATIRLFPTKPFINTAQQNSSSYSISVPQGTDIDYVIELGTSTLTFQNNALVSCAPSLGTCNPLSLCNHFSSTPLPHVVTFNPLNLCEGLYTFTITEQRTCANSIIATSEPQEYTVLITNPEYSLSDYRRPNLSPIPGVTDDITICSSQGANLLIFAQPMSYSSNLIISSNLPASMLNSTTLPGRVSITVPPNALPVNSIFTLVVSNALPINPNCPFKTFTRTYTIRVLP